MLVLLTGLSRLSPLAVTVTATVLSTWAIRKCCGGNALLCYLFYAKPLAFLCDYLRKSADKKLYSVRYIYYKKLIWDGDLTCHRLLVTFAHISVQLPGDVGWKALPRGNA